MIHALTAPVKGGIIPPMPVNFQADASRILLRMERARANRDRKKVERRLYKEEHGIEDPKLRGVWTERLLCPDDPKRWTIAVPGKFGAVGDLRDVAVHAKSGRVAHVRGAMICAYGPVMMPNPDAESDPAAPRWLEEHCTLLRAGRDIPAGRPDLRALFTGGLGPGGVR